MNFKDIKQKDQTYIANTYHRTDIDIIKGTNASCKSSAGTAYIDFSSGIGVNSLGFAHEKWVKAISEQAASLGHMSNLFYTTPQGKLAEMLCKRTGMKKVFFSNSGAESNECAIKTARKYSSDKYSHDRYEIITLQNSFHGRTIATLAATGQDVFHKNFGPFPDGFIYAEANNFDDILSKISKKTCAIMVELIQGEGGVVPLTSKFVQSIDALCKEQDILFIVDEVQTGIGRTGTFLCTEQYTISPDIITLAKGLAGGLPMGAVLFGNKTMNTLGAGDHATTFGGNPIASAGAQVVLDELTDHFLNTVIEKGNYIKEHLLHLPSVVSITGAGLMLGVELTDAYDNKEIVKQCAEKGLIILTAKNKLRFLPPLSITDDELAKGLDILIDVLS